VLAAQFESCEIRWSVLVSVPMSICGALMPLVFRPSDNEHVTHRSGSSSPYPVSLISQVTADSCDGSRIRKYDCEVRENLDRRRAIERAARVRWRPISDDDRSNGRWAGCPLLIATGAWAGRQVELRTASRFIYRRGWSSAGRVGWHLLGSPSFVPARGLLRCWRRITIDSRATTQF